MDPSTIVVTPDIDDELATQLVLDLDEPAPPATQLMLNNLDEPAPPATQVVSFAGSDAESTSASPLLDYIADPDTIGPETSEGEVYVIAGNIDVIEEPIADPLQGSCSLGPSESEDEVYYYVLSNIMYYIVVLIIMYY
jgi:hypothetical protein